MGVQSFIRKGNKRRKAKHNHEIDKEIWYIKYKEILYKISIVWFNIIIVVVVVLGCALKEFDMMFDFSIALLSLLLLLLGKRRLSYEKTNNLSKYEGILTATISFVLLVYFILVLCSKFHLLEKIPYEESVTRILSCIALIFSVKDEYKANFSYDKDKTKNEISLLEDKKIK